MVENVLDCYCLDTNSKPNKYRLLPISRIVPDYRSKEPKRQEYSRYFWDLIYAKLSFLLRNGVDQAFKKGLVNSIKRDRFFVSSKIYIPSYYVTF